MKRSPMPRGKGFKRPELPRTPPVIKPIPEEMRCRISDGAARLSVPLPKTVVYRSEKHRKLVASYECIHCGIHGFSQCAHADGYAGKAMGKKEDDRWTYPACGPHMVGSRIVPGCHHDIGTAHIYPRQERLAMEREYVRRTICRVLNERKWPRDLPLPDESLWQEFSTEKEIA